MTANRLKVCSFNAEYSKIGNNYCLDTGSNSKYIKKIPDSLLAAIIAIQILSSKADIYNIQNIKNEHIVEHLLKEISRVKDIMDSVDSCNKYVVPQICDGCYPPDRVKYFSNIACMLNKFPGLCPNAITIKEILECCGIYGLDYVPLQILAAASNMCCANYDGMMNAKELENYVMKYKGVDEYNAYYCGSCLTLVKKTLCIIPKTRIISHVDSIVLFFEFIGQRFTNVNINFGCVESFIKSFDNTKEKRIQVDNIVKFLKKHKAGSAIIMAGAFNDIDYDTSQLLFNDDNSKCSTKVNIMVPTDYPYDSSDPIYTTIKPKVNIPYALLLQYIRLMKYKLMKYKKCYFKPKKESKYDYAIPRPNYVYPDTTPIYVQYYINRAQSRQNEYDRHRDIIEPYNKKGKHINKGKTSNRKTDKKYDRYDSDYQQVVKCSECVNYMYNESKHKINVDGCKDLCKKHKTSCCSTLCNDVCKGKCADFRYCDTISILKTCLSLYNALNKISDINNRYTGFYKHYNAHLSKIYPNGVFQAWALNKDYDKPHKHLRTIDNNSELLALSHFLISDCIKNNISYACFSDIFMQKCNTDVNILTNSSKKGVFKYDGSIVKSFFTNRVYTLDFTFPYVIKELRIDYTESLYSIGLTNLWSLISTAGSNYVSINIFEKFGLDNHPYFRDFFWQSLPSVWHNLKRQSYSSNELKCLPSFEHNLPLVSDCNSNSALCVQRNFNIYENEFYSHLLYVLANSDTRDRFIMTIAYMDAIYRLDKVKHLLKTKIDVDIICNQKTINDLFTISSMCFKNKLSKGEHFNSIKSSDDTIDYCKNVWKGINMNNVNKLIDVLSFFLVDNRLYMEILIRYAVCVIQMLTDTGCGVATRVKLHTILEVYPVMGPIVANIRCGGDIRQILTTYINALPKGPQQIRTLLLIINEFNLFS